MYERGLRVSPDAGIGGGGYFAATMLARLAICLTVVAMSSLVASAGSANAATLPAGFQESTVFSGLTNPMQIEFADDGRVFVAEKSGLIKVFDNLGDSTPTTFADLRTKVHNYWDRGMLGMALAPDFPSDPYVYVLYTHDAAIGGTAPRWGTAGATSDGCPTPPGPTGDGCVVSGRLSRLQAQGNTMTGSEQVLIEDWCQQYPSHSVGDLAFGADGALYVSGGDGASFNFADYGQDGSPLNPCGDPPVPVGGTQTPPNAEGGALRSQDVRTGGTSGPGGSFTLRPNADVSSDWNVWGQPTSWGVLDDDVVAPRDLQRDRFDQPSEHHTYAAAQGSSTEVGLSSASLGGATPSQGKAWFFMSTGPGQAVRADVIWGGQVRASRTVSHPDGTDYQWHSIDVVPPNQAAVDDLRIRFTVTVEGTVEGNKWVDLFATYFDLQTSGGTSGDPTGLDGTVLRVDPATGAGLPGNPLASSGDPNNRRMIAHGLRNPFRFAIRPGTNEVWLGDVGWNTWEEINRITNPTDGSVDNFGWPCYEGTGRQGGYDSANLSLCESLYSAPNVVNPYYAWNHSSKVVSGEGCPTGGSSAAGIDFYEGGPYPADYDGAMFFADYSRDCIWAMKAQGGLPNPGSIVTFVDGAANPVDVIVGPDGALYYADFDGGNVKKVTFASANRPPVADATANPTSGGAPLNVQFSGAGSSDPDPGDSLTYAWDLDGDGQYDDSTAVNPTRTYAAGTYTVRLRVTDESGASATDSLTISAGNTAPTATINAPSSSTTWQVGSTLSFSGSAADAQDGTLPASRFSWSLELQHCPSTCHTHPIQSWPGVTSGSFVAPDHEYPSHLTLKLTVTDSGGLTATRQVNLNPQTVRITLSSYNPTGLQLTFNGTTATSSFTRTVIRNSVNSISAPSPQTKSGRRYAFQSWSDGGAQTHNITATGNRTYRATYRRISNSSSFRAACKKRKGSRAKRKRCASRRSRSR
jgi:glucose/arabinose dehydrogenase